MRMKLTSFLSSLFLFPLSLFAENLSNTALMEKINERFPELELSSISSESLKVHPCQNVDALMTALSSAQTSSENDLILLDGSLSQSWTLSSTLTIQGSSDKGQIVLLSMNPETGSFHQPVTLKNYGLYLKTGNTISVKLANFAIDGASTTSEVTQYSSGIAINGGTLIASCISVINADVKSILNSFIYGSAVCTYQSIQSTLSVQATFYNSTFANNSSDSAYTQAAAYCRGGSLSFVHCTFKENSNGSVAGPASLTNCLVDIAPTSITSGYLLSNTIGLLTTNNERYVPYCLGIGEGSGTTVIDSQFLRYDALGNPRKYGDLPDYGVAEAIQIELPNEFVILPSGTQQIYFGLTPISRGTFYIETRLSESEDWVRIPEEELIASPQEGTLATVSGWKSFRYYVSDFTKKKHFYRLCVTDSINTLRSEPIEITLTTVPRYASRPSSKKTIYLDFGGYVIDSKTRLDIALKNNFLVQNYICTAPFDYTGGPAQRTGTTETTECSTDRAIYDIWRMVAEDFSSFDVNVTTIEPHPNQLSKNDENDETYGVRVVIGFAEDKNGNLGNWAQVGGLATWNSFNSSMDEPIFVFGTSSRQNAACQITHEVSHSLGLHHDEGILYLKDVTVYENGIFVDYPELFRENEYYQGNEFVQGTVWYPIMGGVPTSTTDNNHNPFDQFDFINQWSKGDYTSATDTHRENRGIPQDDFAIMLGLWKGIPYINLDNQFYQYDDYGLRLIEDDHCDSFGEATVLQFENNVVESTGHISKHVDENNKTVLNDVDCFKLTTSGRATLSVDITPEYRDAYQPYGSIDFAEGSSLNAYVEVYKEDGTCIGGTGLSKKYYAFRDANLKVELPRKGTYIIRVSGTFVDFKLETALRPEGYENVEEWYPNDRSNYGSIGPYSLKACLTPLEEISQPGYRLLLR